MFAYRSNKPTEYCLFLYYHLNFLHWDFQVAKNLFLSSKLCKFCKHALIPSIKSKK